MTIRSSSRSDLHLALIEQTRILMLQRCSVREAEDIDTITVIDQLKLGHGEE